MYNDSVAAVFNILAINKHVEMYIVPINTTNEVPLQISVLMIEYLVITLYKTWMM